MKSIKRNYGQKPRPSFASLANKKYHGNRKQAKPSIIFGSIVTIATWLYSLIIYQFM